MTLGERCLAARAWRDESPHLDWFAERGRIHVVVALRHWHMQTGLGRLRRLVDQQPGRVREHGKVRIRDVQRCRVRIFA